MPRTKRTDDKEGHGFTQSDWEAVSDNPEWTEADFQLAQSFTDLFPEMAAKPETE
jgi:hypothetical protein